MSQSFSGAITAIASPFLSDESIDSKAFVKLVSRQKQSGISGIVVSGTTGEGPTLAMEERIELLELALKEQSDNFKIYLGLGTNSTKNTVAEVRRVVEHFKNADKKPNGIMIVLPYYNKPTQSGLLGHFDRICSEFPDLNLCIYNVPSRTGSSISPQTFTKLCSTFKNIVAIKEASADLRLMVEFRNAIDAANLPTKVNLLSGDDCSFIPALLCGADGIISVTGNLFPHTIVKMISAFKNRDFYELRSLHLDTLELNSSLFICPNPVPLKWALEKMNLCNGRLRLPLSSMSEKEGHLLEEVLNKFILKGYT